jgi:hypothetical protein
MTVGEGSEFWIRLVRCINDVLRTSGDNNIRFLWVDDFVPGTIVTQLDQGMVLARAFVSEDSGKSFAEYRVTVHLSKSAADAYRVNEWTRLLPQPGSTGWLTITRTTREIAIECA